MTPLAKPVTLPEPGLQRGACPTLAVPMKTGDGLLARLRPLNCALSADQLKALAVAAQQFGNGIIEVTARGSLQLRGIRNETVRAVEQAVFAAEIEVPQGVTVETPPLAGLDASEITDVRPLAAEIRAAIAAHWPSLVLAPKLTITVDGGGIFHLGAQSADLRVTAMRIAGQVQYLVALGGTQVTAQRIALLPVEKVVPSVLQILALLSAKGPKVRGRDVDPAELGTLAQPAEVLADLPLSETPPPLAGLHTISSKVTLGITFPYNQATSEMLLLLADAITLSGASDLRLAPDHSLLIPGLSQDQALLLQQTSATLGFVTSAVDLRRHIALCPGSRGCASGFYDTRAVAEAVLEHAPDLLDGSFTLHLSGCAKGCAHPAATALTLVGAPTGYGLVVNGAASQPPSPYIAAKVLNSTLGRLASAVAAAKEAEETVRACLDRLGAEGVSASLQLDGK